MLRHWRERRSIVITVTWTALVFTLAAMQSALADPHGAAVLERIRKYHNELKDLSSSFSVEDENTDALSKISPDFAQFVKYGFRDFHYYYKNPDKVRIESNATLFGLLKGISIRNGGHKNFFVPKWGIHKTADVTGQSNKKETALDFGLIAGDLWNDYAIWFIRSEKDNGRVTYVIGLRPQNEPHGGTMVVRVDADTMRVCERDRYGMDGAITQREYFSNYLHPLPHLWIPTVIRLFNGSGQFGGDLVYTHVAVNAGLPDSLFTG